MSDIDDLVGKRQSEPSAQSDSSPTAPTAPARRRGHVDLLQSPYRSSLIAFALPLTISFLVNMLYMLIDRWFISHMGTDAIAAIGLGEQINFLVFTLGSGFSMGTGVIVARRIGEGDQHAADSTATQAIVFMLVATIVLSVGLQLSLSSILERFNAAPQVSAYAQQYLTAIFLGFSANLLTFQVNAIVRSTGNVFYPMVILLSTTVANAVLAPIFIFVFNMGMYGAGLATATAQCLGAVFNIILLLRGKAGIHLRLEGFRVHADTIRRIVRLGFPSSVQMMAVSLTRLTIYKLVTGFGTIVMAAYTLGISVDAIVFMFVFSVGISIEVATGQNLGARKFDRVLGYHRAAIEILGVVIAVLGVLFYLFGSSFAAIYTTDAGVIAEVQKYLHVSVFGYVGFAVGIVSARVISGSGAAYASLAIVAGSILFLQLPLVYVFSQYTGWNQVGIWIGSAAGYGLFALASLIAVRSNMWREAKV